MDAISIIKELLLKKCDDHNKKFDYDFWNQHIKLVVDNSTILAKEYDADLEIVTLAAMLHDIAKVINEDRDEHHIYGADIAESLLKEIKYPNDRIALVKKCILNHRRSNSIYRTTKEEICVADGDAMAHFDNIPMLFYLAYVKKKLTIDDGKKFVANKLQKSYDRLSDESKEICKAKFENIMKVFISRKQIQEKSHVI